MFNKEKNLEKLNKIMGAIAGRRGMIWDDNKETHNVQLEEEIPQ